MKKFLFICVTLCCISYLLIPTAYVQGQQDTVAIVEQLSSELEKTGVCTAEDLRRIKRPLKNMLDRGATKRGLKRTLKDLSTKGVKGRNLKRTIDSMNELVKDGENPKMAGNIVSRAARQAHIEGLKGRELAARVHKAIKQRRQERRQIKQRMRKQRREFKEEKGSKSESKQRELRQKKAKGSKKDRKW